MEIFDLTQGDSNEEQEASEAEDETSELTIFAVTEIAETYEAMDDEETFYDCDEELKDELKPPSMEETEAQTSGRRDDGEAKAMVEPMKICMIKNVVALEVPSVIMTIDSGADVSVAPERFYNLGVPGAGKPIEMIDAQGAKICSRGNRRLRLQAQTRDGEVIEFIEQFALGVGVTHPLLSFGRLLKQGWGLSKDDHGLFLEHPEKTVKIPARLERNSLVMDVKICAVRAEGDEPEELQVNAVSGGREEAVESGGDTRPPEHPSTAASGESAAAACEKGDNEDDDVTLELMHQLSNEGDPGQDESRSPGYTTEESSDIMVKGSSSEDGKVKEKLARWERWNFKFKEVRKEPVELSSPEEQVRPVRGAPRQLHAYISRELGLLERLPGWHALPNGIVVHSKPMASHFHDPSSSFGDEWCGRLTLAKMTDGSDQWEQLENLANYKDTPLPFRPLPHGPRTTLTFVAPGLIKDYFVVTSEVPVSQYPLLNGEPASWPEDEQEDQEGGEIPWLAAGGGERPEIAEDVHFVDPDELEVSIDELTFNKDNKLKDLQDMCRKLGLPTSGSKVKVLRRLQQHKHHEEEKIAYEIAQRLYSEQRREAIPVKTPKLPTKHEQELHQLTHLPFQAWCQQCVATRAKEDVRTDADTADRKDRGRNVISFDYGYTYTSGAAEEKQWGTALYVAESESKAVLCIPVQAKGSLSLRQITEELTRFSMQAVEDAEGNEMIEQEAKTVGEDVALGMYGHGPDTEDVSPKRQKTAEAAKPATSVETERHAPGSSSVTTLPQGSLKRELFSLPWDAEDDEKLRMSPKKKVRAIQEEFPGGDDMLAEEILQSALNDVSEDEEGEGHAKERPPDVSEEELAALDDEACRHEERRLEQMGVLEKVKDGEPDEEGEEPEEKQQPQQVEDETDIEKVNMQWQIVRLEVALAENDEYLKEMTEEKDRMMHEYLRFADMNVNLRGQLEDLREENLGLTNRLLRRGGSHDEKEEEIQRLDEEIKQVKEVNVLLKARIDEMNQASNSRLKESLDGVKFEMERKQWMMTHSGECYHAETCSHVANRAKKTIRPPDLPFLSRKPDYPARCNQSGGNQIPKRKGEDEPPGTSSLEETGVQDLRAQCNEEEMDEIRVRMVKNEVCAVRADDIEGEPMTVENEGNGNDGGNGDHVEVPEGDRGVKRTAEQVEETRRMEEHQTLALMQELSEQIPTPGGDQPVEETPMKKSKTVEAEARESGSPGYTTEESGDVVVKQAVKMEECRRTTACVAPGLIRDYFVLNSGEEEKLAYEVAQRLFAEFGANSVWLRKAPKIPEAMRGEPAGSFPPGSFSYLMEIIEKGITIRPDQQHIKELATLTNVSWTSIRLEAAIWLLWLDSRVTVAHPSSLSTLLEATEASLSRDEALPASPRQVNRGDLVGHLDLAHLDTGQAEAIQIAEKKAWLTAFVVRVQDATKKPGIVGWMSRHWKA
ncbi:unnamed protein product [Durusdinium trenchii]|uniref:SAP domain-containing protein n=1 Tax=Durusdinium trenchii TaxID=1381693 RepID=A0ABP0NET9_9DINO